MPEEKLRRNVFQAGGTLSSSMPSYIVRSADDDIYEFLKSGEFCYVLTARQMGKSSLCVRTKKRLEADGFSCVFVDINAVGSKNVNIEQWYYSFLYQISYQLDINFVSELTTFWQEKPNRSPINRMVDFFDNVILKNIQNEVVIFIDEIDSILSIEKTSFNTDDFFAALRTFYNGRVLHPNFQRLNFTLIGVATPYDLAPDASRTPFNVGEAIQLKNFTLEEILPLRQGFTHINCDVGELLAEVHRWTNGQPVMTQKLCQEIARNETVITNIVGTVAKYVNNLFLQSRIKSSDDNLSNISHRILDNKKYNAKMLSVYEKIITGVKTEVNSELKEHLYLKLSGVIYDEDGFLVLSNKIYEKRFDKDWLYVSIKKIGRPFSNYMNEWLESDKASQKALYGKLLEQAFTWANARELTSLEWEFLEFSRKTQDKAREEDAKARVNEIRRQRKQRTWLAVTLLATIGLALFLVFQSGKITRIKDAFRLTIQALQLTETDPSTALRLATEAEKLYNDEIIRKAGYKIYRDNLFYKKLIERKHTINALSISTTQQLIATASRDKSAYIWNYDGKAVGVLRGHQGFVNDVAFSPDGKKIVTVSSDNTVIIWNENYEKDTVLRSHTRLMKCVAYAPNGRFFVTGSVDKTARIWNSVSFSSVVLNHSNESVKAVAISQNSDLIATISEDKVFFWDTTGRLVKKFKIEENEYVEGTSVAFAPETDLIIVGCVDKKARLFSQNGKLLHTYKEHSRKINSVAFAPSGETFLTGSEDRTVCLWDTAGNLVHKFPVHDGSVNDVAFLGDSSSFLTAGSNYVVKLWRMSGMNIKTFNWNPYNVRSAEITSDLTKLIIGTSNAYGFLIDVKTHDTLTKFRGHKGTILDVDISPNGKYFLTASHDKKIHLWDNIGSLVTVFNGHRGRVNSAIFSPTGDSIISASDDNTVRIWSAMTGKTLNMLEGHDGKVVSVAISKDGKFILGGSTDRTAILWSINGQKIAVLEGHKEKIASVAFSPDGKLLLTTSSDATAKIWNRKGLLLKTLSKHDGYVLSGCFSPDGTLVLTGSADMTARLWDLDGHELHVFEGFDRPIYNVRFTEDNKYILIQSSDGSAHLRLSKLHKDEFLNSKYIDFLTEKQLREYSVRE